MTRERRASWLVGEKTYFVTTIFWENDLTGMSWYESGIRDLDAPPKENFTLVQHDIGPLDRGHRYVIEELRHGRHPNELYQRGMIGALRAMQEMAEARKGEARK